MEACNKIKKAYAHFYAGSIAGVTKGVKLIMSSMTDWMKKIGKCMIDMNLAGGELYASLYDPVGWVVIAENIVWWWWDIYNNVTAL